MPSPQGYILRHPEPEEAPAVQAVMDAAESADAGEPRRHMSDVASEWRDPECRPAENWRVAVAPDGFIAAVGWVWPETSSEVTADHYVHPEHRGRGLGEAMLDAIEARAAELPARREDGAPRRLVVWCEDSDATRRAALDRRGFTAVRQYFEMEIRLGRRPPRRALASGDRRSRVPAGGRRPARVEGRYRGVLRAPPLRGSVLRGVAPASSREDGLGSDALVARLGRGRAGRLRHRGSVASRAP